MWLDLPPFEVLAAALDDDDDDDDIVGAPDKPDDDNDEALYEPLPLDYDLPEQDPTWSLLSASIAHLLNTSQHGNSGKNLSVNEKVTSPSLMRQQQTPSSFCQQEAQMSSYTASLAHQTATSTSKPTTAKKTRKGIKRKSKKSNKNGLVKPKKPLDAHSLFVQHERIKLLASTDMALQDMTALIEQGWKTADKATVQYYQQLEAHEAKLYQTAVTRYRRQARAKHKQQKELLQQANAADSSSSSIVTASTATTISQSPTSSLMIVEPTPITPNSSCQEFAYSNDDSPAGMKDLAHKLGDDATRTFIQMFSC